MLQRCKCNILTKIMEVSYLHILAEEVFTDSSLLPSCHKPQACSNRSASHCQVVSQSVRDCEQRWAESPFNGFYCSAETSTQSRPSLQDPMFLCQGGCRFISIYDLMGNLWHCKRYKKSVSCNINLDLPVLATKRGGSRPLFWLPWCSTLPCIIHPSLTLNK